jgi:4-diphosphocytidyl-2-C-methyl-D-erythritol kinase
MKKYTAYAKVNIFLKITGTRGVYHTLASRFMIVQDLYDTLWFAPKETQGFEITGAFTCTIQQNTIYKAYKALLEATKSQKLQDFFQKYSVHVEKKIPSFAGLGGGSSDAATFLHMCNETLSLGLSKEQLAAIGAKVGADVAFFVYGYTSANVSGVGEIVEPFEEDPLSLAIITPDVQGSTPDVYKVYREKFFHPTDVNTANKLFQTPSATILENLDAKEANDLLLPALFLYDELKSYAVAPWFFSGSGSSFFKKI